MMWTRNSVILLVLSVVTRSWLGDLDYAEWNNEYCARCDRVTGRSVRFHLLGPETGGMSFRSSTAMLFTSIKPRNECVYAAT
jgi:hypothetical protein